MNRRLAEAWTAWLLPLIFFQLLLPSGFMPARDAHGPSLILCSAKLAGSIAAPTLAHGDTSSSHHRSSHHRAHADSVCAFAAAATAAPPYARVVPAVQLPLPNLGPEHAVFTVAAAFGPLRSQLSRAPPFPS
jgi:hypothetical protein